MAPGIKENPKEIPRHQSGQVELSSFSAWLKEQQTKYVDESEGASPWATSGNTGEGDTDFTSKFSAEFRTNFIATQKQFFPKPLLQRRMVHSRLQSVNNSTLGELSDCFESSSESGEDSSPISPMLPKLRK